MYLRIVLIHNEILYFKCERMRTKTFYIYLLIKNNLHIKHSDVENRGGDTERLQLNRNPMFVQKLNQPS